MGLDFSGLDAEYKQVYDERARVNKQGVEMAARFKAMPLHEDAPKDEVSVASLMDELERRQIINRDNTKERVKLDESARRVSAVTDRIREINDEIARLQSELSKWTNDLVCARAAVDNQKEAVSKLKDEDTDSIRQQIKDAESTNAKVRANRQRAELETSLTTKREESSKLTSRLKEIDASKAQQMAEAKWPVPGLGFDADGGITLNGLPFEQASSAEQLRVSVAIGAAMNPTLRVMLIRDGSLLDEEHLEIVRKMAEEFDTQVFLERVSEGSECSVIISDGMVKQEPAKSNGSLFKE